VPKNLQQQQQQLAKFGIGASLRRAAAMMLSLSRNGNRAGGGELSL
jgi:hypothetical protein